LAALRSTEILFVNPPANEIFEVNGEIEMISNVRPSSHPLAQFIDWSQVSVFKTMQLVLPAWASPLITAEETPLVFIGQHEGQRIAVVGFDLHNSDLPLQVTFPILFANLFDFLAPHGVVSSPNGNTPNGPVQILPGAGTEAIAISKPDGETVVIDLPGSSIQFNETDQSGVYTVRSNDGENFQETSFTVNLFSEVESQIAVREEVEIGRSSITASGHDEISNQEAWSWLIGLALLFLLIEWYAYHRRLGIR
jgi:hypothetical protein